MANSGIIQWVRQGFLLIVAGIFFLVSGPSGNAQSEIGYGGVERQTYIFSDRNDGLKLDVYCANGMRDSVKPAIIFVFGGGFRRGTRSTPHYLGYYQALVKSGLKVVAIDYRLGLKDDYDKVGLFNTKPLETAVDMAVEDLFDATAYLLANHEALKINPDQIILSGTSAGAITCLTADWYKRSGHALARHLPEDFQYDGVVAFSGAIVSISGKPKYDTPPAPVMMFHGAADKLVRPNKVKIFKKGMFGSRYIAKRFDRKDFPYHYVEVEETGHQVAAFAMYRFIDDIIQFIDEAILKEERYQYRATVGSLGS